MIVVVEITAGHPPVAASVLLTVYVPGVLEARVTSPVAALITNPEVELNVPEVLPPAMVGVGLVAF